MTGLYAIVDPLRFEQPTAMFEAIVGAGIRLIQIRSKSGLDTENLEGFVAAIRSAGGIAIVNDRIDLAELADGVHLGAEDAEGVDLAALRERLGPQAWIGLSAATPAEVTAAHPAIDYFGVGPMYATATKADAGPPIGTAGVAAVAAATARPVAAIGGITAERLGAVRRSGAAMAAIAGALVDAPDVTAAARALQRAWESG